MVIVVWFFFIFVDEDNVGLIDVFIYDRDMDWLYECDGNICKREKIKFN